MNNKPKTNSELLKLRCARLLSAIPSFVDQFLQHTGTTTTTQAALDTDINLKEIDAIFEEKKVDALEIQNFSGGRLVLEVASHLGENSPYDREKEKKGSRHDDDVSCAIG